MAKTNRRPSDKFERKQRLAQRPRRQGDDFEGFVRKDWGTSQWEEDEISEANMLANEISSPRTNRAY